LKLNLRSIQEGEASIPFWMEKYSAGALRIQERLTWEAPECSAYVALSWRETQDGSVDLVLEEIISWELPGVGALEESDYPQIKLGIVAGSSAWSNQIRE